MSTKWIVNNKVVAEAPSIFDNKDLSTEVANGINGKDRRAPAALSSRERRKKKS